MLASSDELLSDGSVDSCNSLTNLLIRQVFKAVFDLDLLGQDRDRDLQVVGGTLLTGSSNGIRYILPLSERCKPAIAQHDLAA